MILTMVRQLNPLNKHLNGFGTTVMLVSNVSSTCALVTTKRRLHTPYDRATLKGIHYALLR